MEQFDTLVGELTVTEMLMYTAELKRSSQEPLQVSIPTALDCSNCSAVCSCIGASAVSRCLSW